MMRVAVGCGAANNMRAAIQDTSLDAYRDTEAIREQQIAMVFEALRFKREATALELVYSLGGLLDIVQVRRRLSDLKRLGKAADSGKRRKSNGRTTIVWMEAMPARSCQGRLW